MTDHVFVLGMHRGGTTYTQRVLNTHPDVAIWGENNALLTHLREASEAYRDGGVRASAPPVDEFQPWANPTTDIAPHLARMLDQIWTRTETWTRAGDHEVTGFKEIRHNDPDDIAFLYTLFPTTHIVAVLRDPRDVGVSQYACPWMTIDDPKQHAEKILRQHDQVQTLYEDQAEQRPGQFHVHEFERLVRDPAAVFDPLPIDLPREARRRAENLPKVGSSHQDVADPNVTEDDKRDYLATFDQVHDNLTEDAP